MKTILLTLMILGTCFGRGIVFANEIDAYTKLLLHNDDASFIDSSASNHSVVNNGAQLDTANKILGAGSAYFEGGSFDGQQYFSGDYLSVLDSDDWNFGTDDFTIDLWFNPKNITARFPIISQGSDGNNFWRMEWDQAAPGGSKLAFEVRQGGQFTFLHRPDLSLSSADAWYHVAEVRSGDNWFMFFNGDLIDVIASNITIPDYAGNLEVGRVPLLAGGYTYTNGNLDEVRISKGIARWTSDFNPLAESVVPEPTTLLLLGMSLLGFAFNRKK